jgi:hypothetical protein
MSDNGPTSTHLPPSTVHVPHLTHAGPTTQPNPHHANSHAAHQAKRNTQGAAPAAPAQSAVTNERRLTDADLDDDRLATGIIESELQIVTFWFMALTSFDKVLTSSTRESANAHFGDAIFDVFAEKVLGSFAEATGADDVFDVFKGIIAEADRAKAAATSADLRDFYTSHTTAIARVEAQLTDGKQLFIQSAKNRSERLQRDNPDEYGMFRMELMQRYTDAEQRLRTSTQESLFSALTEQWLAGAAGSEIFINIYDDNLEVFKVEVHAPDGDQIGEQLAAIHANYWHLKVPRVYAYYKRHGGNGFPAGYVRVDAQNRLTNSPAEDNHDFRQVYARLSEQ